MFGFKLEVAHVGEWGSWGLMTATCGMLIIFFLFGICDDYFYSYIHDSKSYIARVYQSLTVLKWMWICNQLTHVLN
jgi:hypothetical protein